MHRHAELAVADPGQAGDAFADLVVAGVGEAQAQPVPAADGTAIKLTYHSPDGEEGYPGNLTATVIYTLTDDNTLRIEYSAVSQPPGTFCWRIQVGTLGSIMAAQMTLVAPKETRTEPVAWAATPASKVMGRS